MVKISIIIPCFNAEAYINKCLSSFEKQSFRDFEIILINDCSTDNTKQEIQKIKERGTLKIKYIENTKNSGPAASRNTGIKIASGEWISFCDCDDWYESNFLEIMLKQAENEKCDVVFCGYNLIIGTKKIKHTLSNTNKIINSKDALLLNVDSLCVMLVKQEIISQISQPEIRNGEDMAIIPVIITKATQIGIVPSALYNYYIRKGSASTSPSLKVVDSLIKSYDFINSKIDSEYKLEKEYIGIRNLIYGALLNLFKCSYNTKKANEILTYFNQFFPFWYKNPYIHKLPITKRIFIKLAQHKNFMALRLLSLLHQKILK